jgi:hypothetical protein
MGETNAIPAEEANGAEAAPVIPPVEGQEGDLGAAPVEGQEGDGIPAEPTDNSERTKLGRKVAHMAEQLEGIGDIKNALTEMQNTISQFRGGGNPAGAEDFRYSQPPAAPEVNDDEILTAGEVRKLFQEENNRAKQNEDNYRNSYANELSKLARERGISKEEYKEIETELLSNYYGTFNSGNAIQDAQGQFFAAENAVLRKRISAGTERKPNLNGGQPSAALGMPAAETRAPAQAAASRIDAETAQLLKEMGKDPTDPKSIEWANKILNEK